MFRENYVNNHVTNELWEPQAIQNGGAFKNLPPAN